jgi:hypothetical protein
VHTWCDDDGLLTAEFTTPTGDRHRSTASPVLGDLVLGAELAWHHAS